MPNILFSNLLPKYRSHINVNFFKEGFLIDYIQKFIFDLFILNWIILGSFKINFSFFNLMQSKIFFNHIYLFLFSKYITASTLSFNNYFIFTLVSIYFYIIFIFIFL
jgi:hypothetical protein